MPEQTLTQLRIWQQNLNKSITAQEDLLHHALPTNYDILALQEPYIDTLKNTRATQHWRVHYPTVRDRDTSGRTRATLLINNQLSTGSWAPLTVPHPDVAAITIKTGGAQLHLLNLYVDGEHDTAIHAATRATRAAIAASAGPHHVVWLGDFNRHHPAWDDPANFQLFSRRNVQRADLLIARIADFGLEIALPPTIPTLESTRDKSLTRPDNVFCSQELHEALRSCTVHPELRPAKTDHFPIITVFDIPLQAAAPRVARDYRRVDWEDFRKALASRLDARAPPDNALATREGFDAALAALMDDLQHTIDEQVPLAPATPFAKRWWSTELGKMRKEKERLGRVSHYHRRDKHHPAHVTR